jgi:prolyl-tRNA editing enzyme YbaK/EbsC (Cys-tRNA(Pro) deacylase)
MVQASRRNILGVVPREVCLSSLAGRGVFCVDGEHMHPTTARVVAVLDAAGFATDVREFSNATRTAQQAADALGVPVGAIVKSLCFVADGAAVMVLVSGANRADLDKVRQVLDATTVTRADAETVRAATGFAIGGVPPVGHARRLQIILDRDLQQYPELWAAAGTPHSVFRVDPARLAELTSGAWADVAEVPTS